MSKKRRKPNNRPNRNRPNTQSQNPAAQTATGAETAEAEVVAVTEDVQAEASETAVGEVYETEAPANDAGADYEAEASEMVAGEGYEDETPEATVMNEEEYYTEESEEYGQDSVMQDVMKEHTFYAPRSSEETDWEDDEEEEEAAYNRDSVNRMKKAILIGLLILFLIPLILCFILFIKMSGMKKEMEQLREELNSRKERMQQVQMAEQTTEDFSARDREAYANLEKERGSITPVLHQSGEAVTDEEETSEEATTEAVDPSDVEEGKKIYITFDDGPSANTGMLLDVLKEKNVKASFFMVLNDRCDQTVIRRMVAEGHTIGIHSASHVYADIYADLGSFKQDVQTVHDLLYEMTGVDVKYYRFPGGSSNRVSDVPVEECIEYLEEAGYTYFDWNASNGDSSGAGYTADQLTENVLRYVHNNTGASVVLMHDFDTCPETIEALPGLIDTLREEGYVFLPIDETTAPVHHRKTAKEQAAEIEEEKAKLEKASEEKAELERLSEEREQEALE